ncbi:ABC transporter substrate-binding protein [Hyphococcus flavus]|uniref:ABC transporter substrate-binding protein n=1 Tax=Hyphococcus flavus TaxID=1866326 RepID=A0AAE9ZE20_9PROT|nr:ABC transporter substrate-binding protein [Hyphococcus flavus]WDI31282.1 ABC transporter substrate-binding protein [Hyphococcus flavus]
MRILFSILLALLFTTSAIAADLDEIKQRGTLRVAVAALSPFVIKADDGTLSGFEIDSTQGLGAHLGVDIEYVEKPFCDLAEAVLSGEADVIASGYSNMPERRRLLDFSLPYHDTEYFVIMTKRQAKKAKTLRGINSKDIRIGFQHGGVSGMVAHGEFPGSDLKGFSSFTQILEAMESGEVDGAVLFDPYLDMAKDIESKKFTVPHEFALTRTIEAFATDQNSDALHEALNEWVIGQDLEGYWDDLEKKWFSDQHAIASAPPPYACAAVQPVQ